MTLSKQNQWMSVRNVTHSAMLGVLVSILIFQHAAEAAPRKSKASQASSKKSGGAQKTKSTSSAPLRVPQVVKLAPGAQQGCFSNLSYEDAVAAVKRFNLTPNKGNKNEVIALGKGLIWLEVLNGGNPLDSAINKTYRVRGSFSYPVNWTNVGRTSSQTAGGLNILRKNNYGHNVAQIIHELGHLVGNQGYYQKYASFRASQKIGFCVVSGYSHTKNPARRPSENWAEIFAAFTTTPQLIKNNSSPACQKTWDYFKNNVFEKGELAEACGTPRAEELVKARLIAAKEEAQRPRQAVAATPETPAVEKAPTENSAPAEKEPQTTVQTEKKSKPGKKTSAEAKATKLSSNSDPDREAINETISKMQDSYTNPTDLLVPTGNQ